MRDLGGPWSLVLVNLAVWGIITVGTQVLLTPSLGTVPTILIGVVVTSILTLGYPSALRGPGATRFLGGAEGRTRRSARRRVVATAEPLRAGLTAESAAKTVRLLRPILDADAVALTDRSEILAYTGRGAEQHGSGTPLQTTATRRALDTASTVVVTDPADLQPDTPFASAVVVPLRVSGEVVGTLKAYRVREDPPLPELVEALAGVLSLQLELADVDRERELAANAKLDALRAQINPHFLFNILNTIASKARTDPETARGLLLRLSDFFRYSIQQQGQFAEFGQEYFFVRTYLTLEQARYGDRLGVDYDIDPQVLTARVPVLIIQPLVENAVKHGLAQAVDGGTVTLRAKADPLSRTTTVVVADDGVGMPPEVVDHLFDPPGDHLHPVADEGSGIALRNISARLSQLFGERHSLRVESSPGEGTVVELRMPLT
ncbi:histidine kinase [Euzebya sp.]|uniref:histidine kinase n=1 Tax=Euzebya sp. TaxID=1971409 RepID=UPI003512F1D8